VKPITVPDLAGRGLHWIGAVFLEPLVGIEEEKLLAPQHPGQRLAHYVSRIFADLGRGYRLIERVGLAPALTLS
jgi:hypothetical protein